METGVQTRSLHESRTQAWLNAQGLPFVNTAPVNMGPVPDLFTPDMWDKIRRTETADYPNHIEERASFIDYLGGNHPDIPRPALVVARRIINLEMELFPEVSPATRQLKYRARIEGSGVDSGAAHFDGAGVHRVLNHDFADAIYTTASMHGTVGFEGLMHVPKDSNGYTQYPVPYSVDGEPLEPIPTTAQHLHRFDGLHGVPRVPSADQPEERLLHLFNVSPTQDIPGFDQPPRPETKRTIFILNLGQ